MRGAARAERCGGCDAPLVSGELVHRVRWQAPYPLLFRFTAAREGTAFGRPPTAAIAALERVRAEGGGGGVVDGVSEAADFRCGGDAG